MVLILLFTPPGQARWLQRYPPSTALRGVQSGQALNDARHQVATALEPLPGTSGESTFCTVTVPSGAAHSSKSESAVARNRRFRVGRQALAGSARLRRLTLRG